MFIYLHIFLFKCQVFIIICNELKMVLSKNRSRMHFVRNYIRIINKQVFCSVHVTICKELFCVYNYQMTTESVKILNTQLLHTNTHMKKDKMKNYVCVDKDRCVKMLKSFQPPPFPNDKENQSNIRIILNSFYTRQRNLLLSYVEQIKESYTYVLFPAERFLVYLSGL